MMVVEVKPFRDLGRCQHLKRTKFVSLAAGSVAGGSSIIALLFGRLPLT